MIVERVIQGGLRITALVLGADGSLLGWQDKVQLDPSEEDRYVPGTKRRVFKAGPLTFGVVICHEGWRYPETSAPSVTDFGAPVVRSAPSENDEGRDPPVSLAESHG